MRKIMIAALLLAGCGGPRIDHDYASNADFGALKTWSWMPSRGENGLNRERARAAVESELARKGFSKVERSPDFHVALHLATQRRIESDPYPVGYGYGRGFMYSGRVYEVDEGALILDIVRASDRELIWRGRAVDTLDPDRSPQERDARIRDAVREILEPFPPKGSR